MSFQGAVDRIGTWAVTGVTTNYGLDDFPGMLPESALPALVLAGGPKAGGGKPFDLGLAKAKATIFIDHTLAYRGVGLGTPQSNFYGCVPLVDNYIAKVKTDWTLNSNLLEPLEIVATAFEPVVFGNITYWGVVFRHKWVLTI